MQRKLTFLACVLACATCFAQYPFVYYTPKDGLVNSRVRGIKQDSRGRMIFFTFGGLSIYDGTRFVNYNRQDGLADELINDVVEITADSFLVATNASKLNTLVKGKVGVYKTDDNFYPVINHFLKGNDGYWYVTADDGLFVLKDNRFRRFSLRDKSGTDIGFYLDRILEWKNYFLLIPWSDSLTEKLILFDRARGRVADVDMKNTVFDVERDRNGRIWLATNNGPQMIDTVALENGKINLAPLTEHFRNIVGTKPVSVFFDKENDLWLYYKDIQKVTPQMQVQYITAEQGLEAVTITDLFIDREGIVWLATDGNGIIKIRNTNTELIHRFNQKTISISTIMNHRDTMWLFNSSDNSVYRFADNKFKAFPFLEGKVSASSIYVIGQKMLLSDGGKLYVIKNKNEASSYTHPNALKAIYSPGGMGCGTIDRNGVLIQYIRQNQDSFFLYAIKDDKILMRHLLSHFIDQMAFDRRGLLWMATRNNHVLVFSLHPEDPDHYLQLENDYAKEFPDLNPRAITVDTENNVWIGTRLNGVYRCEFKDGKLKSRTSFTTRNGLTDNFVYTLSCDSNNTVWVGTQTGLDRIFRKSGQYIIGNVSKNNNFYQTVSKIEISRNNQVWALTNAGIILRTSPLASSLKSNSTPLLYFTSQQVNNKPYLDSSTKFNSKQNNLSFSVAASSFFDEKSIKYSYVLDGSGNKVWSEPQSNPNLTFINLPPGDYTLNVKAEFPEATYPEQIISYPFSISPPWWQTWWFRVSVVLAGLGVLFLTIRFYYRRKLEKERFVLERQQAIEKERTRIATDMHDDLGAGLSRIKFLSETIGIKKQRQIPFEDDITKIREYSHEMIDKMGEIVWALNEKNDSLSDLLSYTRSYTVEYLSQSGVSCSVNLPESLPSEFVSGEFRRNIFLSVKEILHNVVKHSQANHVSINIQVNRKLYISIQDDGIGFDRSKTRPYSNGLVNIEKRMKDIEGLMEIQCSNGTLVTLVAPLS